MSKWMRNTTGELLLEYAGAIFRSPVPHHIRVTMLASIFCVCLIFLSLHQFNDSVAPCPYVVTNFSATIGPFMCAQGIAQ